MIDEKLYGAQPFYEEEIPLGPITKWEIFFGVLLIVSLPVTWYLCAAVVFGWFPF